MKGSVSLGEFRGTKVRVHWTFFLFLTWVAVTYYLKGGVAVATDAVSFILLLFLCVVLHEFGHIAAARHFGVRTPEIVLLPIGGMSRMDRIPDSPHQELLIALAGPAVTFAIAVVLTLLLGHFPDVQQITKEPSGRTLLAQLAYANLTLFIFNLLPVFPLDGGRVLRALLSARVGHLRATRIAAVVGRVCAVLFVLAGFAAGNPMLVLIAVFVFIAGGSEASLAAVRDSIHGVPASEVMITSVPALSGDVQVRDAADSLSRTTERAVPVIDGSQRVVGVVTRDEIAGALKRGLANEPVTQIMQHEVATVEGARSVDRAVDLLQQGRPLVAVTGTRGQLLGIVTWENLAQRLMLTEAAERGSHTRRVPAQAF